MTPLSIATRIFLVAGIVFLILAGVAGWILRDQVYQTFQDPGEPFQTYTPPAGVDYHAPEAWFVSDMPQTDTQPAVFFIHPTTYSGGSNWNAQLDKDSANMAVTSNAIPNFAAPFRHSASLFVPRYRQAALYAFMNNREDSVLARQFAYRDVQRAFRIFLDRIGEERAFVIAGVGQGGLHALGLLMTEIASDDDLTARLAVAYVIESPVPLDLFNGPLAGIPPCETADSIRCVYAYSAARADEDDRIHILTERAMSWTPDMGMGFVEGRGLLCINPLLSARSNEFAPARQHRGGVAAQGLTPDVQPAPIPAQTGAQCTAGILLIEEPRSEALQRPRRLAEDYREPPFNLFYEDLRLDAARRLFTHATILEEERRWAPDLTPPEDVRESNFVPIPDRREF